MIETLDIQSLSAAIQSGRLDPADLLTEVWNRADEYSDPHVWIDRFDEESVMAQLAGATARRERGIAQPLLGIPFAIKDNIDVASRRTTAACPAFAYVAEKSAPVVQRLCDAGAIAMGKTNLDQFATGLVGTRSPFGACKNVFDERYISGGSSSGSAVAVAAGLVSFALGTDTAGSGRIPAAFNNIVGLKPSRGLLSTVGVVPACRSLDCVSIFSRNCSDAATLFDLLLSCDPADPFARHAGQLAAAFIPTSKFRFGVPRKKDLKFFGNATAEKIYFDAVRRLQELGGIAVEIDYSPFAEAAALLYDGPWVAERYLVARELLGRNPEALLPVIRTIMEKGKNFSAADAFEATYKLGLLKQASLAQWKSMDVLLLPTAGTIYTIEQVQADPFQLNSNLGFYTNFVNLLDLCGVAVPAGFAADGLPFGVSLIAPAGTESSILRIGDALHRSSGCGVGAARAMLPAPVPFKGSQGRTRLAVVGAHLSGMPLNHQLVDRNATLIASTKTASRYRLYALPGTNPPKPGLVRVAEGGASIELEIWEMSHEAFGHFVAAIPSPLGIGTLELLDGSTVQGFACESYAVAGATDITHFGGWRAYMKSR
jgi:allophanate hydrolase